MDVENKYASKGVAGSGLGLGIAGTALGVLNGAGGIASLLGLGKSNDTSTPVVIPVPVSGYGMSNYGSCSENTPVTRYEMTMQQEIAAKDARIGLLESNIYTDQKIVDTYTTLNRQIDNLAAEVRANKDAQVAINMEQAVYNGTNTAALGCLQAQVAQLQGLTKLVVPNTSVCPGWGDVTITAGTTATA